MYAKLRLPPQNRSCSRCSFRQTAILGGSDGRIEPIYFLYRDANFLAEKKSCFFGSPGCVSLLRASPGFPGLPGIDFTIKKLIFTKKIENPGISSETTRESRVRRRGNLESDDP